MNLTTAEQGIIRLLAKGYNQKQAAAAAGMSHENARYITTKLRRQFGVKTTAQLIAVASAERIAAPLTGRVCICGHDLAVHVGKLLVCVRGCNCQELDAEQRRG